MSLALPAYNLLPAFSKPFKNELFSSWLARMAFDHGLGPRDFFRLICSRFCNLDIDRRIKEDNIREIAELTGCTHGEIKTTTLKHYEHILFRRTKDFSVDRWMIVGKKISRNNLPSYYSSGLMYCPVCLKKEPYFRKQWRLGISFVCPECECYLVEKCPHCKKGNSFMDVVGNSFFEQTLTEFLLNCHHCGNDVTQTEPARAKENIVTVQKELYSYIGHGEHNGKPKMDLYFDALHYLASLLVYDCTSKSRVKNFIRDVYTQYGFDTPVQHSPFETQIKDLPVRKRAIVISLAFWLLEEWPYRFINLCNSHELRYGDVLSDFSYIPAWLREMVIKELSARSIPLEADKDQYSDTCTVRMKENHNNRVDYDYDLSEYYFDDTVYDDIDLSLYII